MHPYEAQYKLLYTVVVAGKNAQFAEKAMGRFLARSKPLGPFDWIDHLDKRGLLEKRMRKARMGCYSRLTRSFREIAAARPDLMTATPPELEKLHGIGPKSSRFAIMWVRPGASTRFAALDTHVLKWLRFLGHKAPKATPSGELYLKLENIFLAEADRRRMAPRMLDAMIWENCSTQLSSGQPITWPAWLQPTPATPPESVVEYFKSFAA